MTHGLARIRNEQAVPLKDIPEFSGDEFVEEFSRLLAKGYRVCAYFGIPEADGHVRLLAVCGDDRNGVLYALCGTCDSGRFPSLACTHPQVQVFEREIHEQTGLVPDGHPWLKPVRFPTGGGEGSGRAEIETYSNYFHMHGEEVHEVAVGPVHAGIIEPGHFRFQCHGETVYHLEIMLGYQHRGIEGAVVGGPHARTPHQMEAIAGDTSVGHMMAYCQILESLSGLRPTPYEHLVRAVALELERCANHAGDLGALAGEVAFLPTLSYCGRIRGDFLNMTALLCGNRFGRGLLKPGGVKYAVDEAMAKDISGRLSRTLDDFLGATAPLWCESAVAARFEGTGRLSKETAGRIGLVGPAARACGCVHDVRQDYAQGFYRFAHIPVSTHDTGDVFGRAHVRWREVRASVEFCLEHLDKLETLSRTRNGKSPASESSPLQANTLCVSLVEGWRGEVCHVAITDTAGRFREYKIIDPSFHNWFGLALAMRNEQISDFPLCNKSFNLSYCGFDL